MLESDAMEAARTAWDEGELLEEMASFGTEDTGVDNSIFISTAYPQHSPRIKLAIDPPDSFNPRGVTASIAIDSGEVVAGKVLSARLRNQVKQFIDLNRSVLLDYWNCKISTAELYRRLKSIEGHRPD